MSETTKTDDFQCWSVKIYRGHMDGNMFCLTTPGSALNLEQTVLYIERERVCKYSVYIYIYIYIYMKSTLVI